MLTLDSQLAMDTILLQSTQPVDILSIKHGGGKKNHIDGEGSQLLATLKIDAEDVKRVQLKIRIGEGRLGSLNIFIIPKENSKNNTCPAI